MLDSGPDSMWRELSRIIAYLRVREDPCRDRGAMRLSWSDTCLDRYR